jgi:hypothetical protein
MPDYLRLSLNRDPNFRTIFTFGDATRICGTNTWGCSACVNWSNGQDKV